METYTDTYANIPAAGTDGNLFLPSNGLCVYRDTGAVWNPWGPVFPLVTPPALASLTWINQGGATATETNGGIHLYGPAGAGNNTRALVVATGTAPWVFTVSFLPHSWDVTFNMIGIVCRESGTQELETMGFYGYRIAGDRLNNPTSWNSRWIAWTPPKENRSLFFRVEDNNTNRIYWISPDGRNWYQVGSFGRTTFLTADQVGIFVESNNATWAVGLTLLSWELT